MQCLDIERYGWHASTDKNSINCSQIVGTIDRPDLSELDLLVRECVQNSLDSAIDLDDMQGRVYVDFINQGFDGRGFLSFLQPTAERAFSTFLGKRRLDDSRLIAVRDDGTTGVDGDVADHNSRVFKLLTGFLNGKDNSAGQSGLGGSHGAGKTVVLKLGVGLVVYYTRIKISERKYGQRLWVYYCENGAGKVFENVRYNGDEYLPSRLAWWGKMRAGFENSVCPITDDTQINGVLSTLGIRPFDSEKTGTVIAIPFVDEEKILSAIQSAAVEYDDKDDRPMPWWRTSILGYMQHAVAQWYAPRIAQLSDDVIRFRYFRGPALVCKFGEENKLKQLNGASKDFAAFRLINRMFAMAVDKNVHSSNGQIGAEQPYKLEVPYGQRKWSRSWFSLKSNAPLGWVVLVKLSRSSELITELFPGFSPSKDGFRLVYARSPGLILTYDDATWSNSLCAYPLTPDEVLWGIFVPNVYNRIKADDPMVLKGIDDSFEAPFRDSEGFDHGKWPEGSMWPKNAISESPYKILHMVYLRLQQAIADLAKLVNPDVGEVAVKSISTGALWGSFLGTGGAGFGGPRDNPNGNLGRTRKSRSTGGGGHRRETDMQLGEPEYSSWGKSLRISYPFEILFGNDDLEIIVEPTVLKGSSSRSTFNDWQKDVHDKKTAEEFPCRLDPLVGLKAAVDNAKISSGCISIRRGSVKKVSGSISYVLTRNDVVTDLKISYINAQGGDAK